MIQRYMKGKAAKDKVLTIKMIAQRIELSRILQEMKEKERNQSATFLQVFFSGKLKVIKAKELLQKLRFLKICKIKEELK